MNANLQDLTVKIFECVTRYEMGKSKAARSFGVGHSSMKRDVGMARISFWKGIQLRV